MKMSFWSSKSFQWGGLIQGIGLVLKIQRLKNDLNLYQCVDIDDLNPTQVISLKTDIVFSRYRVLIELSNKQIFAELTG